MTTIRPWRQIRNPLVTCLESPTPILKTLAHTPAPCPFKQGIWASPWTYPPHFEDRIELWFPSWNSPNTRSHTCCTPCRHVYAFTIPSSNRLGIMVQSWSSEHLHRCLMHRSIVLTSKASCLTPLHFSIHHKSWVLTRPPWSRISR